MSFSHHDLWDAGHIRQQLSIRALSELKVFLYFLAITAFDWLQFTAMRLERSAGTLSTPERTGAWVAVAITLVGVIFLFLCNGGPRGRDFLYRYFPLSAVVGWKFAVLMTAVVAIGQLEGWNAVAVMVAGNALMFGRIGQHLRALASAA